jgi:hypothetical protein
MNTCCSYSKRILIDYIVEIWEKNCFFFIEFTAILLYWLYKSDTLIMINNFLESVGLNRKRPFHELASEFNSYPPEKRFDYNRLSGRGGRPMLRGVRGGRGRGRGGFRPEGTLSTQLAVRNIPPGINTIAHLNNHFARFGSLVNVQVHFEGDPASALVSYCKWLTSMSDLKCGKLSTFLESL